MTVETTSYDLIWEAEQDEPPSLGLSAFIPSLFLSLELEAVQVAILITSDAVIQNYNRDFRGKDRPTDVLSFPAMVTQGQKQRHLGDLVISMDRAQVQAEEIGQKVEQEIRFLILHGVLHLLGYDHEVDNGEMLLRQTELKAMLADFF